MKIRRLTTAKGEDRGSGSGGGGGEYGVFTHLLVVGRGEGGRYVNCGCSHINKLRSSQNVCRFY